MIINYFLILGSVLDLFLTYKYLGIYKAKFPNKDWVAIEANPLVRYCIRAKGLGEGILVAGTLIMFIMIIIVKLAPTNLKFFLTGALYMMNVFHLTNFLAIKRMKEVKTNGKKENKS